MRRAAAGDLKFRVGFYKRTTQDDGMGNTEAGFSPTKEFEVAAAIEPKLGGEGVLSARLESRNIVNITVRRSITTMQITPDWCAKDERSGDIYNIRSIIDPDGKNAFLEMLCEKGVAT